MAPLRTDESATVVVAGAGLAGLRAAETLRGDGFRGRLVLVGAEAHRPYDRPPLSKQYLAGTWGRERLCLRRDEAFDELGLDLRLGVPAVACDVAGRSVTLADGEVLGWDGLVVATGAVPRTFAGAAGIPGVHVLRTIGDADRLAASLGRPEPAPGDRAPGGGARAGGGAPVGGRAPRRVVVVGAGFIGSEVAATATGLGAAVTVVEPLAAPLARALGERIGRVCSELHSAHGVDVRTGTGAGALLLADGTRVALGSLAEAAAAAGDGGPAGPAPVAGVELDDGSVVGADAVVVGVGVVPATGWLAGSGLSLHDGVEADATLHAADGVVVAGDVARWPRHGTATTVRLEHWTNASEQGVAAARSLLAGRAAAAAFDPVPYVWSDQYDVKIQVIGFPAADDDVEVVDGDLGERRFVAVYARGGAVTGAVGFGRPRQLMTVRPLVQRSAPVAEARAALAG